MHAAIAVFVNVTAAENSTWRHIIRYISFVVLTSSAFSSYVLYIEAEV
jgi:hypothetical protein